MSRPSAFCLLLAVVSSWLPLPQGSTRSEEFFVGFPGSAAMYFETMVSDLELLEAYAREKSEESFTALVNRHLNLVYSAALRQVRSPQLAQEVAQSVFTDLSRAAVKLKPDTILTAWLYQVTRRTTIDAVRREARRQLREQIATEMNTLHTDVLSPQNGTPADDWSHIELMLDDAMDMRSIIGPNGYGSTDFLSSEIGNTLNQVTKAFSEANNGNEPADAFQLLPYATTPEQQAAVQK